LHLISIIFLGIAANIDNLGIGVAYGIRSIKIPFIANLVIAIMSGIATFLTCYAGHLLEFVIPTYFCNILGGGIVILVGFYMIISFVARKKPDTESNTSNETNECTDEEANTNILLYIIKHPEKADIDYSGQISVAESILLGIALSINALATGFGAGMTGLSVIGMTLSVVLFSLITIFIGVRTGKKYFSRFIGDKGNVIAGLILVIIGIFETVF